MTRDPNLFNQYSPCTGNFFVRIADGSLSKIAGIGFVIILEDLTLNSVLLVPSLECNLLSISKLTQEINCVANFFSKML